jgi:TRAP-type C4-dicarboxylate transport system permease small subunit
LRILTSINLVIDKVLRSIITVTLGVMLVLIFVQVVSRYAFHYSLSFSEELARYLFVWTVFLGIPVVQRMGGHMIVGVITERISGMPLKVLRIVAHILTVIFMIIILKNGILMVQRTSFQTSPAMQIPMSYIYYVLPIGSLAMILNTIEDLLKTLATPASETKPELGAE